MQRPQEALTAHAVDAMLRTVNAVRGPVTGAAPELAVTTGDAIDNAQWNEMQAFLALFDGGRCGRTPARRATPACSRWTGRTTFSGSRTAPLTSGPTCSAASSASRTIPGCCSARWWSSPQPA